MSDLAISAATALDHTTISASDLVPVVHVSASTGSKGSKITVGELFLGRNIGVATATSINALPMRADATAVSTFVGIQSGQNSTVTDTKNTGFGCYALATAGGGGLDSANSAFGFKSLFLLTTGKSNTGVGDGTLMSETTGSQNTAIGVHALLNGNGASNNIAIGYRACENLTTGTNNTIIGTAAATAAVTGTGNTAMGYTAAGSLTSGNYNTFLGYSAAPNLTTGGSNISIGFIAGFGISTGSNNVCIGQSSGQSSNGSNSIFIGFEAGKNETGSQKLYIDSSSTATPLIGGDFSARTVALNGDVTIQSGKFLQLGNAATTGLSAGVLAALTNATITVKDSTGQTYRIPCII